MDQKYARTIKMSLMRFLLLLCTVFTVFTAGTCAAQMASGPSAAQTASGPSATQSASGPSAALSASGPATASAAQPLTIDECYRLAEKNFPQTRERDLIRSTRDYTVDNLIKGVIPQFNVRGSATYQSAVTSINIPKIAGSPFEGYNLTIPKDQYLLDGEVSQTLTDFGINKAKRKVSTADAEVQEENLNTQLYQLRSRVNDLYFGVLLVDGQIAQNELSIQDIQTGIKSMQAAVDYGTSFRSNLEKLQADLLSTQQRSIELKATRRGYTDMLSLFLNEEVNDSTAFSTPESPELSDSINRPELKYYDAQIHSYLEQRKLNRLNTYPQLNAFFQGGIGQPSPVNMLSTQLSPYYLTGLRLTWNFGALYTIKKDQLINKNNQDMAQTERSTFLFNTDLTLRQENADVRKYKSMIEADDAIITLRTSIKTASTAQLKNGVLSANDYLLDIHAEALARQDKVVHQIQLLMSEYDHKTTSGN
jgi:outer membrane protein TolC